MKKILLFLFATITSFSVAQNVGINATGAVPNTSAMLDVAATNKGVSFPNVALISETDAVTIPTPMTGLMVYNTTATMPCGAGLYFNDGTAAAPIWTCFSKTTRNFHAFDNAGRTNVTSAAATQQPNVTFTFVIPAGQTADLKIDAYVGGTNVSTTAGDRSIVDVIIYQNGTFLPQGGWDRITCANPGSGGNGFFGASITTWSPGLTAGTYTISMRTARFAGNTGVTIGGDCALTTNCGELHGTLYYK